MYRWLFATLLLWAVPAAAQNRLFNPLPAPVSETPAAADAIRSRGVVLNPTALAALMSTQGHATLNLFDDLSVDLTALTVTPGPLGHQMLHGQMSDGGTATFAIIDGTVTAQISTGGHSITVQPLSGGTHRIAEFAKAAQIDDTFRPTLRPEDAAPRRAPVEKPSVEKPAATTQIRILVAYTPKALSYLPSLAVLRSTVALMMDDLNTTLTNSNIPVEAVLTGIEQVNYTEPTGLTSQTLIDTAEANTGDFARIQSLRAATGADIVSVLTGYSDATSCGRGSLNDYLDTVSQLRPYTSNGLNVVSVNPGCQSIMTLSFTHEIGHNLGADHDRYVLTNPLPGPQFYAAGYVDLTGRFRDTMAYDDQCEANKVDCPRLQYFSNPDLTYNTRPLGVADNLPAAADASRRIREIAPYVAQFHGLLSAPAQPMLAVLVSGSGTVSGGGIDCGATCAVSTTSGQSVTLAANAPTGWSFASWGGACSGSGACTVSMTASKSVTATFIPTLRFGPVFSSAQAASQSFIRLANTGSSAATVTVKLWDYTTGALAGTWTSPSIPAGTAPQYAISTIESAVTGTKPQYYAVAVQTAMTGTTQHVLWKPSDGTLTNLSTCDTGISAGTGQMASVHSSILDSPGYPSSIAINNTSASSATGVTLGIYDARNGTKLGTYPAGTIPANSKLVVGVAAIESAANIRPASDMFHYIIKPEGSFTGFLQHLVNNQKVGVITDMSTVCGFGLGATPLQTIAIRAPGPLYSTAQTASQSFLRFTNTGTTAGSVAVTLSNSATGTRYGQWISPAIPPGAAPQYAISDIENTLPVSPKPQYYTAMIETQITGSVAHVLWKPSDGTLTNLSTCDAGVSSNAGLIASVHSSRLDSGYPSTVAVSNTGSSAQTLTLGVFDARTGTRLGTYTTTSIPANGQQLLAVAAIERAINLTPAADMFHYVIKLESGTGFLQHLVNNQTAAVITDMTTVCQLPTKAVSFTDCAPGITPRCTATVGSSTSGQLKQATSWQNYDVALTAGRTYTIDVKGASSGNGTLAEPYIFVYTVGGQSALAQGGSGGTGNDARITFTPTTTATYVIQVSTYILADNAGTFVLTVN